MNLQSTHQGTKRTVFSETCVSIMDFFLQNVTLYFTPKTVSLSMSVSHSTIKDCMQLLKKNQYLSKESDGGSVYHITKENMEFWHTDFKNHVLTLADLKSNDIA